MAYLVMAYLVMAYLIVAYIDSYGLHSYVRVLSFRDLKGRYLEVRGPAGSRRLKVGGLKIEHGRT